ncbi:hypothetical protein SESBI_50174 [Sesbania bispinosa]|nr:hypothetical protein SESBI_50174 [Sesbania bispinosa]
MLKFSKPNTNLNLVVPACVHLLPSLSHFLRRPPPHLCLRLLSSATSVPLSAVPLAVVRPQLRSSVAYVPPSAVPLAAVRVRLRSPAACVSGHRVCLCLCFVCFFQVCSLFSVHPLSSAITGNNRPTS